MRGRETSDSPFSRSPLDDADGPRLLRSVDDAVGRPPRAADTTDQGLGSELDALAARTTRPSTSAEQASSASAEARFAPDPAALAAAADADRVVSGAGAQLNYLSHVSVQLGLPDPVQEYFGPIVGRWRDLHDQAEVWRRAAASAEELAERVTAPLGHLDAVWHGQVSDAFLEHMRQIATASTSASDAMGTMAEVLDRTAEAMHQLVTDTVDLLSGGANRVSMALLLPLMGEPRAIGHIAELHGHGRRMMELARELLEAFGAMCRSLDAAQPFAEVTMATSYPSADFAFTPEPPAAPAEPARAPDPAAGVAAAGVGVSGMGGGGFGGGAGGFGGGSGGFGGGGGGGLGAGSAPAAAAPLEPGLRTFAAEPSGVGQQPAATGQGQGSPVAGSAAAAARGGGMGGGFMPMAPGMGAGQGGDAERRGKSNVTADPVDIFGKPTKTAPPVIGED